MNILFAIYRYPGFGGIERVTKMLSEEFCKRMGYDVTVFSMSRQVIPSQILDLPNWHYITTDLIGTDLIRYFQKVVRERHIDVIIYQDSYAPCEYIFDGIEKSNIKIIVCEHSVPNALEQGLTFAVKNTPIVSLKGVCRRILYPYSYFRIHRKAKLHHRKLFKLSDKYILLSDTFKPIIRREYEISGVKLISIPNPIDDRIFDTNELNLKEKIVLFVGRLTPSKGVDYLLDVWHLVTKTNLDWKLIVVGDGTERDYMERRIYAEQIPNIELVGEREDVTPYYQKASVLFMTSVYEGFGLVLVEAQRYGVVPFAFNSYPSVHDIITDGENGFLIDSFNTKMYARVFNSFVQSENKTNIANKALVSSGKFRKEYICNIWRELLKNIG